MLIPGADAMAWSWHRVVPELRALGHDTVTLDLPSDADAGLVEQTDAVVDAVRAAAAQPRSAHDPDSVPRAAPRADPGVDPGGEGRMVVVAASLGAFIGPLVCTRIPVNLLVLLNAMVPAPGESAGEWWGNTGQAEARAADGARVGRAPDAEFDPRADFFHDVPAAVTEEAFAGAPGAPSDALFADPWPLPAWPDVPTRFLQGRDDRFFPVEFQRRVARERLGIEIEEMPGGHLVPLSQPVELARRLDAYVRTLPAPH